MFLFSLLVLCWNLVNALPLSANVVESTMDEGQVNAQLNKMSADLAEQYYKFQVYVHLHDAQVQMSEELQAFNGAMNRYGGMVVESQHLIRYIDDTFEAYQEVMNIWTQRFTDEGSAVSKAFRRLLEGQDPFTARMPTVFWEDEKGEVQFDGFIEPNRLNEQGYDLKWKDGETTGELKLPDVNMGEITGEVGLADAEIEKLAADAEKSLGKETAEALEGLLGRVPR